MNVRSQSTDPSVDFTSSAFQPLPFNKFTKLLLRGVILRIARLNTPLEGSSGFELSGGRSGETLVRL